MHASRTPAGAPAHKRAAAAPLHALVRCREHLAAAQVQAQSDQEAAERRFRAWAAKYVDDAALMNISSGLQIRQLLFPDAVEGGVRVFKALNPDYERLIADGAKPKPRRWLDFELHGLWGRAVPGRLQVEVQTDKGSPAVSSAVLRWAGVCGLWRRGSARAGVHCWSCWLVFIRAKRTTRLCCPRKWWIESAGAHL